MSDIPEHIWEAARSLRNAVCWQSNSSVEPIAAALLAAEQRGREMERYACAAIADEIEQPGIPGSKQWMALGNFAGQIAEAIRSRSEGKGE